MIADEGKAQREQILRQQMKTHQGGARRGRRGRRGRGAPRAPAQRRAARRGEEGRAQAARAPARHAAAVGRVQRDAHLPRVDRRPAVEQDDARQARRRGDAPLPRRGPLRPREDQEAHHRVRRRAQARGEQEGAHPLLHRPARRRQDVARSIDRALDGAALPPHRARRRARRGRDPRAPAHVRRRAARAHPPGDEEGRGEEPGHRPRRGRQDGRRPAGRSGGRAPRGARSRSRTRPSRTTTSTCRSTSRRSRSSARRTTRRPSRAPLLDRMEVIECPGYTRTEKLDIAQGVPRAPSSSARTASPTSASSSGTTGSSASSTATRARRACAASSARSASVCRHVAMRIAEGETTLSLVADAEVVEKILGAPRYLPDLAERTSAPGVATGLAWTPSGGDILFIEATKMPGQGRGARHRQPAERDERERGDGRLVRAQPREGPRARSRVPQGDRPAPPRARRAARRRTVRAPA